MNPLYKDSLGSIIRLVLAVAAGGGLFSQDDAEKYASAITVVAVGAWGIWQKLHTDKRLKDAGAR